MGFLAITVVLLKPEPVSREMPGGRISDQKRRLPITLRTVED
jgi:hypothetical protein